MTPHIIVSKFVQRQTAKSVFSSFYRDKWDEVLRRTVADWDKRVPGYRDGVVLVPLSNVNGFYTSTCLLRPGDKLAGEYRARQEGELPRKSTGVVGGKKIPAGRVDIVCYHRDVLAESNENTVLANDTQFFGWHKAPFAEWEIISINASITNEPEPMTPGTLMANHFHVPGSNDGGTSTGMSDAEFVAALRKSYDYWRDKSKIA